VGFDRASKRLSFSHLSRSASCLLYVVHIETCKSRPSEDLRLKIHTLLASNQELTGKKVFLVRFCSKVGLLLP